LPGGGPLIQVLEFHSDDCGLESIKAEIPSDNSMIYFGLEPCDRRHFSLSARSDS
jgi:hypothetical protein